MDLDFVTVYHCETNRVQAEELGVKLVKFGEVDFSYTTVDNRYENRGFGPACNLGASAGSAPVIMLLNPDVEVHGLFMRQVVDLFTQYAGVVIAGENFGKPAWEHRLWGVDDWVCGAAMAVRRSWWEANGGFDVTYKWGWEETDLIRRAAYQRKAVRVISLPMTHRSPVADSTEDKEYKQHHFDIGAAYFRRKWGLA